MVISIDWTHPMILDITEELIPTNYTIYVKFFDDNLIFATSQLSVFYYCYTMTVRIVVDAT
jgi:hypothetical protein